MMQTGCMMQTGENKNHDENHLPFPLPFPRDQTYHWIRNNDSASDCIWIKKRRLSNEKELIRLGIVYLVNRLINITRNKSNKIKMNNNYMITAYALNKTGDRNEPCSDEKKFSAILTRK